MIGRWNWHNRTPGYTLINRMTENLKVQECPPPLSRLGEKCHWFSLNLLKLFGENRPFYFLLLFFLVRSYWYQWFFFWQVRSLLLAVCCVPSHKRKSPVWMLWMVTDNGYPRRDVAHCRWFRRTEDTIVRPQNWQPNISWVGGIYFSITFFFSQLLDS